MQCNLNPLLVTDPFRTVRRDFEQGMGVPADDPHPMAIIESDADVSVSVDLPGVPESAIEITVDKDVLTISGVREPATPERAKVLFSNQSHGEFRKCLRLHDSIDPDSLDAVMQNGVLRITMKRRPELQPRKVSVRRAASQ